MTNEKQDGGPAFPIQIENLTDEIGLFMGIEINPKTKKIFGGMTLREYAAIKLRVPDSGEAWLDNMIRESLRDEFAEKAMEGMITSWPTSGDRIEHIPTVAKKAYHFAGAMLAAREEK